MQSGVKFLGSGLTVQSRPREIVAHALNDCQHWPFIQELTIFKGILLFISNRGLRDPAFCWRFNVASKLRNA
jgi:hypothetical protein